MTGKPGMPPVPWPFLGQPETYHMAVRLYLETVIVRAQDRAGITDRSQAPAMHHVIVVLMGDAKALRAARNRGEPV